ncbi:MAG: hypothetical protein FWG03_08025 [Clostridiales bacterium]|nr:hypothetical protein [Clostridiales bacterium]
MRKFVFEPIFRDFSPIGPTATKNRKPGHDGDGVKTALLAAAQNLTSFFMAQIKAEPLSEEGLPGEEESFEEVGDRRELCHDERCVTGGLERHRGDV